MHIKQEKVKKISKILSYVFFVFYWLGYGLTALGCLAYLVQFFLPEALFQLKGGAMGFTVDNTLYFDTAQNSSINVRSLIQTLTPFAIVILVMLLVGIKQVMEILKSVAQDNPFAPENASKLFIIGFDLLIASVFVSIAKCVSYAMLIKLFALSEISVNFSVNPTLLMAGFLILILAGVFQYGNYLKNEYDATI